MLSKLKKIKNKFPDFISDNNEFHLDNYYTNIDKQITVILARPKKEKLTFDIMDTEKSKKNKLIVLQEKQRQIKIGEIMQVIIGNYDNFYNLGNNHKTGLDVISEKRKIIIELKNRTNTDNASSKKSNFDKLAKYKINNPEYTCIYGCINDNTKKNTNRGKINSIIYNGAEIKIYIGNKLLELIFGEHKESIITHVKELVDKLT